MSRRFSLTARSAGLAALTLLGFASPAPPAARAAEQAPTKQQDRFEADFLKGMIDHHAMAVEMAMACDDRAVHDDLCDRIIAAQTAEMETMQG